MVFLLLFVLGASAGSFLNVVIDRLPSRLTLSGRSRCDWCGETLGIRDLIPILSFFVLGRRCRRCKKPISWQYPIVEVLTGTLFVLTFWRMVANGNFNLAYFVYILFVSCILVVVAAVDFKFSLIPTSAVFAASLVSLFFNYFSRNSGDFVGFTIGAFALAAFFGLIVFLTRGRGMGEGDIVLGFLMGMVLGIRDGTLAVFLAFLLGAVVAIFLIGAGRKRFGQTIPFAPFLVLGFWISLFLGNSIIDYYMRLLY
ncbi:MAG: prepilin peptidase [Candidatus Curtissbacteria bacterium]